MWGLTGAQYQPQGICKSWLSFLEEGLGRRAREDGQFVRNLCGPILSLYVMDPAVLREKPSISD